MVHFSGLQENLRQELARQGTVGLIESTLYISSQKLQTYYAIVDSLEAKKLNVYQSLPLVQPPINYK